jgi:uncharacterized protein YbjQ (UPF0145 family)
MPLNLAEAAQACGVNRSTILRAIKGGRISGARDQAGAWTVEPVELRRVFPPTSIAFASASAAPKAMPEALPEARRHALDRLVQNATAMGANAVLMMRYDSAEIGNTMSEIVAYGTAAVIEPLP